MTEKDGRIVLRARFQAAGLSIVEDHRLTGEGFDVVADGYDPTHQVGYEFITDEAADRAQFTAQAVAALEAQMAEGRLFVLLIDELDAVTEADLSQAADLFLAALRARGCLS